MQNNCLKNGLKLCNGQFKVFPLIFQKEICEKKSKPHQFVTNTKLFVDQNVQDNEGDTLEYRGVIPWESLSLHKTY